MSELSIEETVGESLSTDTDALQYSVAPQLVKYEVCVYQSRFLQLIGNDAPHKVRGGVAWCGQNQMRFSYWILFPLGSITIVFINAKWHLMRHAIYCPMY